MIAKLSPKVYTECTEVMFGIILLVVIALGFGYFATQNTLIIPIILFGYTIWEVPLYVGIGIAFLLGLFLFWLISLVDTVGFAMKLRGKENTIKDTKKNVQDLTRRVNELEIENARLKGELKKESKDPNSL